jgi:alkanesulfonate monooxygenase SsuD/methylene tetrahydromethanopterin reductase-like flavin-dependent oxidoreductase (luciferase family)
VLPKPVQQPHPPVWIGTARSEDSFRWAGKNGFHLMTLPWLYPTPDLLLGFTRSYRDSLADAGHDPATREILGKFHIYVADSCQQALEEATPYLNYYRDVHSAAEPDRNHGSFLSPEKITSQIERGFVIVGDPERCIDAIRRWRELFGLTSVSGTFHFGGMPQELALKNMRLFSERVMPAFS